MRRSLRLALLVCLALGLVAGCDHSPDHFISGSAETLYGDGSIVTESRQVAGFHEISHGTEGALVIDHAPGGLPDLTVEGDQNLLPHIITETTGGNLRLRTEQGFDLEPTRPFRFLATATQLRIVRFTGVGSVDLSGLSTSDLLVKHSGVGDVECGGLSAGSLEIRHSGLGTIRCSGQVDRQTVTVEGEGHYAAPSLASRAATVTISGRGTVTVNVSERLTARVTGLGSVRYVDSSGGRLVVDCRPQSACTP